MESKTDKRETGQGGQMKKLQQFYIMKFSSARLDKFGYHISRGNSKYNTREIRKNGELIALADNQALRTIRDIFQLHSMRFWHAMKVISHSSVSKMRFWNASNLSESLREIRLIRRRG